MNQVRRHTDPPLAVGFGIVPPQQARQAAQLAVGVVVGSALMRRAGADHPMEEVADLASALTRAVHTVD